MASIAYLLHGKLKKVNVGWAMPTPLRKFYIIAFFINKKQRLETKN
ncbi:MAG: hypothetical protein CLLPBCKN_005713 [Chroococcidiopsis cubana SAG 39.79]|nr:hypothetical protein [Chroococcidiopsis cubana SAG 39.79]